MRRAAALLLLAPALLAARPAPHRATAPRRAAAPRAATSPTLLALCTDIKGKVFSVAPKHGWDNDRLPGSVSFMRGPKGRVDILVADRNVAEPGLTVRLTHHSADYSYFILTGIYQESRVDTWAVTFEPGGTGRLVWSSLSTHAPPTDATQGALYTGTCSR